MMVRRLGGAVIRGSSTHTGARALRDYYQALTRDRVLPGHHARWSARPALQIQAGRAAARADVAAADPADGVRGLARLAREVGQVRHPGAVPRAHRHRHRPAALRAARHGCRHARNVAGRDGARATIERACAIKAEIVAEDERESGRRMLLNLGHTLAHAIESISRYRGILHGEAVAMGMVFAARRSEALGLCPPGVVERVESLLRRIGLPTALPRYPRRAYLSALRVDKKRRDARIQFVALRAIGRAETVPLTPAEILPAGG